MILVDSITDVKNRIDAACERCGRSSDEVTLVAVSKTLPTALIVEAYQAGLRIFGESRAQEVREKTVKLPHDIDWHFIGPLQTNKIKYVLPACQLIHSVDSMHLAQSISDFCQRKDISANILLEVNTSEESSKIGIQPDEAKDIFNKIRLLPNINILGLMTIAPFTNVEKDIRKSFRMLAKIKEDLHSEMGRDQQFELSMGMSQDYEIAIEEGSTMIRVGTSIFGPRGGNLKLTPIEIRKQEFKKVMRGYDTVEIDTFLELIANEYENLIKENESLNKQIISMEAELKHFKENEKTLKQTLYKVQETSELSKENSEREANIIKKEADLHAAQITEKARAEVHRMREEFISLKQQKDSFVARLRHLLSSQIELIEVLSVDDEELHTLKSRSKKGNMARQQQNPDINKSRDSERDKKVQEKDKIEDKIDQQVVDQPNSDQPDADKKPGRDFFKDIFSDNLDEDDL